MNATSLPPGKPPAVSLTNVSWAVSDTELLHAVSCYAPAGAFTGIIGPNGSGKTSLLSLLARWQRPATGRILIDGDSVDHWGRGDYARFVATVDQHSVTDLELTVQQVVELGRIPHRGGWARPLREADEVVSASLEATGLTPLRHRLWSTLSGGEKQKTQCARALAQQPSVLLLDEPTNHLDVSASLELLTLVRDLPVTAIAAMHDLTLAAMFCDHLIVLADGRIHAEGAPVDVLTPELLATVYGVDAEVIDHPRTGRPLVVLCASAPGGTDLGGAS